VQAPQQSGTAAVQEAVDKKPQAGQHCSRVLLAAGLEIMAVRVVVIPMGLLRDVVVAQVGQAAVAGESEGLAGIIQPRFRLTTA
jgi:hypothetical protein